MEDELPFAERDARVDALEAALNEALSNRVLLHQAEAQLASVRIAMDAHMKDLSRQIDLEMGITSEPFERRDGSVVFRSAEEISHRSFVAELSSALHLSARQVEQDLDRGWALLNTTPATYAALKDGRISEKHARIISTETVSLFEKDRAEVERIVLERAHELTPPQLKKLVVAEREKIRPRDLDERFNTAKLRRAVWVSPDVNGMAWFGAHLTAIDAALAHDRINEVSKMLGDLDPEDDRTPNQRRADVFRDLLVHGSTGDGLDGGIKGEVIVTVPTATLDRVAAKDPDALGDAPPANEVPAEVEGVGVIDTPTLMTLMAIMGTFRRAELDEHGNIVGLELETYRLSKHLRRFLRFRDGTCRFPGCMAPVWKADADHTIDHQYGGVTSDANLAHLCRRHHTLKHATRWKPRHTEQADGTLIWTSPLGREHITRPVRRSRVRGAPPSGPDGDNSTGGAKAMEAWIVPRPPVDPNAEPGF